MMVELAPAEHIFSLPTTPSAPLPSSSFSGTECPCLSPDRVPHYLRLWPARRLRRRVCDDETTPRPRACCELNSATRARPLPPHVPFHRPTRHKSSEPHSLHSDQQQQQHSRSRSLLGAKGSLRGGGAQCPFPSLAALCLEGRNERFDVARSPRSSSDSLSTFLFFTSRLSFTVG